MRYPEILNILKTKDWRSRRSVRGHYCAQDDTRFLDSPSRQRALEMILPEINKNTQHITTPLQRLGFNGYLKLPSHVHPTVVQNIKDHIFSNPIYDGHVKSYGSQNALYPKDENELSRLPSGYYTSDISTLLQCNEIFNIASDPLIFNLVSSYLGTIPTIYSMNMMWNVSQNRLDDHGVQKFHRDWDDFRSCCVFIYLTDVDESMGPHVYQASSHLECTEEELDGSYPSHIANPKAVDTVGNYCQEIFVGNKGDAFITDPYGLHKGSAIENKGYRGVLWIRYGLYDNYICRNLDKNTSEIPPIFSEKFYPLSEDNYLHHLWRLFLV
jgi:hypothetical protein